MSEMPKIFTIESRFANWLIFLPDSAYLAEFEVVWQIFQIWQNFGRISYIWENFIRMTVVSVTLMLVQEN